MYTVRVERDPESWVLRLPGEDQTVRAANLSEAIDRAPDAVTQANGAAREDFEARTLFWLPDEVKKHLDNALGLRAEAEKYLRAAERAIDTARGAYANLGATSSDAEVIVSSYMDSDLRRARDGSEHGPWNEPPNAVALLIALAEHTEKGWLVWVPEVNGTATAKRLGDVSKMARGLIRAAGFRNDAYVLTDVVVLLADDVSAAFEARDAYRPPGGGTSKEERRELADLGGAILKAMRANGLIKDDMGDVLAVADGSFEGTNNGDVRWSVDVAGNHPRPGSTE